MEKTILRPNLIRLFKINLSVAKKILKANREKDTLCKVGKNKNDSRFLVRNTLGEKTFEN